MTRSFILSLAVLALLALGGAAVAAEKEVPTKITSTKMTYSQDRGNVVFEGKVHVARPDVEIWADRLVVTFPEGQQPAGNSGPGKIDKIVAEGNVRMKNEGREGSAGRAVYDMTLGVLTMEDNPVIREGNNSIKGDIIKFYVKDNRSEVIGGDSGVEAVFFSKGDDLKNELKKK